MRQVSGSAVRTRNRVMKKLMPEFEGRMRGGILPLRSRPERTAIGLLAAVR